MPLPTEADVQAAIATLKSYQGLYINNVLSEDAQMALQLMGNEFSTATSSEINFGADSKVSGSIAALESSVAIDLGKFQSSWTVQVTGTFVGVIQTELTIDGTTYIPVVFRQSQVGRLGNRITIPGLYRGNGGGTSRFRVRAVSWTSGTANITIAGGNVGAVFSNTIQETRELAQYYSTAAGGRASFSVTSGSVAGNNAQLIMAISNPVGSPVDLYFERITLSNSSNGIWTRMRGSTLNVTGTSLIFQNRGGGSNVSEAKAYLSGAATATGGLVTSTTHVSAFIPETIEENGALILLPGQNAVWSFNPSGAGNYTASINIVQWESTLTL